MLSHEKYIRDLASLLSDTNDYLSWVRNDVDETIANKTLASENLSQEDKYTESSELDVLQAVALTSKASEIVMWIFFLISNLMHANIKLDMNGLNF